MLYRAEVGGQFIFIFYGFPQVGFHLLHDIAYQLPAARRCDNGAELPFVLLADIDFIFGEHNPSVRLLYPVVEERVPKRLPFGYFLGGLKDGFVKGDALAA